MTRNERILKKVKLHKVLDANLIVEKYPRSVKNFPQIIKSADKLVEAGKLIKLSNGKYILASKNKLKKSLVRRKLLKAIQNGTKIILSGVKVNGTKYTTEAFPHEILNEHILIKKSNGEGYRQYRLDLIESVKAYPKDINN